MCALKLLASPERIQHVNAVLYSKFAALSKEYSVPESIEVVVFEDEAAMQHWMEIRHMGEQGGKGLAKWNSVQKARFNRMQTGSDALLDFWDWMVANKILTYDEILNVTKTNWQRILRERYFPFLKLQYDGAYTVQPEDIRSFAERIKAIQKRLSGETVAIVYDQLRIEDFYNSISNELYGKNYREVIDEEKPQMSILPSEKAFAYKMKLDAIKHQGIASVQVAEKLLSVEKVADDAGESKDQVRRYIRLTYLIPELLSMVDDGKIAFNPAVELSYLDSYQQRAVLDAMALNDCTPSHAQSIRLKKLAQEGLLDDQIVYAVLAETKPNQQEQLKFKREELRKYFPSGYTEEQMRRDIIKGLELLKRQRERNRDAR